MTGFPYNNAPKMTDHQLNTEKKFIAMTNEQSSWEIK
jgi:hypothetical protein